MADGDLMLEPVLHGAAEIAIPVIVLGEYRYGISHSRHQSRYERWLAEAIGNCRVLVLDDGTSERYAAVRNELRRTGHPIPGNDLWIAALTRQHDLPLLRRDRHFDLFPNLQRVGW